MMSATDDITEILDAVNDGRTEALPRLLAAVYEEMHGIARRHLRHERPDHTLQPTALLNEAYLRLVDQRKRNWANKAQFLAVASTAMRRVLMHHAAKRGAEKRGGDRGRVTLFEAASVFEERADDLLALDEALDQLTTFDPIAARIVEMRFFGGLPVEEVARVLDVPLRTVERSWRATKAWLKCQILE